MLCHCLLSWAHELRRKTLYKDFCLIRKFRVSFVRKPRNDLRKYPFQWGTRGEGGFYHICVSPKGGRFCEQLHTWRPDLVA